MVTIEYTPDASPQSDFDINFNPISIERRGFLETIVLTTILFTQVSITAVMRSRGKVTPSSP